MANPRFSNVAKKTTEI